jgi:GNAT superfamily N-acetyltransferase
MPPAAPASPTPARPALHVEPLTSQRWEDLVDLFGVRGDPARCWCQFFLLTGPQWKAASAEANRAALRRQVEQDPMPPGLIALHGERPVGWVALGPRAAYPRLTAARGLPAASAEDLDDDGVWSVTCFVVRVGHRRRGVAAALLDAAVAFARGRGARVLEGRPVDVSARTAALGSADLYHGVASTFAAAGFVEVGRTAPGRPVVRLALRPGGPPPRPAAHRH